MIIYNDDDLIQDIADKKIIASGGLVVVDSSIQFEETYFYSIICNNRDQLGS